MSRRSTRPPPDTARGFPRPVRGFAGRRAELDRMLAHLDDDVLFLVYGVGGIGKTELVYQLMSEARAQPSWRDAVPVHLEVHAGTTTTRALAQLLAATGAPPQPRRGQPTEEAHLGEQLAALARVLDARPHLVFLDDVHHLPAAPVGRALSFLSRHVRRSRLVVASRREIALRADAAPPVVTTLGPLDAASAEQMVDALAARLAVPRVDLGAVLRGAHGSPFHIRRMLARDAAGDSTLEASLDELSPEARRALALVALAPHRPTMDALRSAWRGHVDEAVRELEQRFLLDSADGRLVVHDLVREALARRATPRELDAARVECAAVCLAEVAPGGLVHVVDAIQLQLAASAWDEAWALIERWHAALAAAGIDHLLLAPLEQLRTALPARRTAIDLLTARSLLRASLLDRAAEALARIEEPLEGADAVHHFALAGEIARRRGELARAESLFDRAVERAPDARARFHARLQTALVVTCRGEGERAREILAAALAELGPSPEQRQRARCSVARSVSWLFDERFERAAVEARVAREALHQALAGPHEHQDLASQLAMIETLAGIGSEDVELARAAVQRMDEGGLRRRVASLYRAIVSYADGEARSASAELIAAHEELRRSGDTLDAYLAGWYGSAALAELGDLADARALAERTTELARAAGLVGLVARSLAQRALLAAESMQGVLAHQIADEALAGAHVGARSRATAHRAHVYAYTIEGDVASALEHLALARAAVADLESATATLELEHAVVELVGGRLEQAVERAERATSLSRPYDAARAHLVLAAAHVARGRRTDVVLAERALAKARELSDRGELRALQVGCAIVAAGLARRTNRARAADEALTEALRAHDPERGSLYAATLLTAIDGGVAARAVPGAVALLAHLGLSEAVDCYLVDRSGRRAATRHDVARERRARELVVDELERVIVAGRGEVEIRQRPLQCALLAELIRARGEPVPAETLYERAWGAAEYHPLQHRNTLYVAINRLRRALEPAFPSREIVERTSGGWRLAAGVDACVAIAARDPSVSPRQTK